MKNNHLDLVNRGARPSNSLNKVLVHLLHRGKWALQWRAITSSLCDCLGTEPSVCWPVQEDGYLNTAFSGRTWSSLRFNIAWTHTSGYWVAPESMYCQNIKPVVKCPSAISWFMSYWAVSLERPLKGRQIFFFNMWDFLKSVQILIGICGEKGVTRWDLSLCPNMFICHGEN